MLRRMMSMASKTSTVRILNGSAMSVGALLESPITNPNKPYQSLIKSVCISAYPIELVLTRKIWRWFLFRLGRSTPDSRTIRVVMFLIHWIQSWTIVQYIKDCDRIDRKRVMRHKSCNDRSGTPMAPIIKIRIFLIEHRNGPEEPLFALQHCDNYNSDACRDNNTSLAPRETITVSVQSSK